MPSFEEFTEFLDSNGCRDLYLAAYLDQNHKPFTQEVYDCLPFPCNVVNVSFDWNRTKEGRLFWKAIDAKWDSRCDHSKSQASSALRKSE